MSVLSRAFVFSPPVRADLTATATTWGLILHRRDAVARNAAWLEGALLALSMGIALGVIALWLMPGVTDQDVVAIKLVASLAASAIAIGVWRLGASGLRAETWIDRKNRVLCQVRRNARGRVTVLTRIPLDDIQSFFIARVREPGRPSQLYARVRGGLTTIPIGSGSAEALEHLHSQLVHVEGRNVASILSQLAMRARRPTAFGRVSRNPSDRQSSVHQRSKSVHPC